MRGRNRPFRDLLVLLCLGAGGIAWADPLQSGSMDAAAAVTLDAGTKVELTLTIPVWAEKAKPGDPIYTQINFPVVAGGSVAIPAGTWVEGKIEAVTKPTRKTNRAELQILFTKIIFANGYTIALPDAGLAAMVADVTVQANTSNDILLDNGAQIEMTLDAPLALDAAKIASALPLSHAPEPGKFKSATLCRPTPGEPGTPGTSDTVIPGSPGTPSTTIPGGPDMPDTVIPGTPSTPDTVIPGTPGTPGTPGSVCPATPIVISSVPVAVMPAQGQRSAPVTAH
jgi:hypothetical protein